MFICRDPDGISFPCEGAVFLSLPGDLRTNRGLSIPGRAISIDQRGAMSSAGVGVRGAI
jgi:hypothetical protein